MYSLLYCRTLMDFFAKLSYALVHRATFSAGSAHCTKHILYTCTQHMECDRARFEINSVHLYFQTITRNLLQRVLRIAACTQRRTWFMEKLEMARFFSSIYDFYFSPTIQLQFLLSYPRELNTRRICYLRSDTARFSFVDFVYMDQIRVRVHLIPEFRNRPEEFVNKRLKRSQDACLRQEFKFLGGKSMNQKIEEKTA